MTDDNRSLGLLTPRTCRMARAGLGIYQDDLAKAAGVHVRTVKMFETDQVRPHRRTSVSLIEAFVAQGVAFGSDGSVRIDQTNRARLL